MKIPEDENNIRDAIGIYLRDSSQDNYQRLKNMIFGELDQNSNLFQALAKLSGPDSSQDRLLW